MSSKTNKFSLSRPVDARIETHRMLLRALVPSDLPAYHTLRADPRVMKFSPTHQPDASEGETWDKLRPLINTDQGGEGEGYMFGIELLEDNSVDGTRQIVGDVGITQFEETGLSGDDFSKSAWEAEIGYMFAPVLWGKGYATEAVRAFVIHWEELMEHLLRGNDGVRPQQVLLKAITEEENVGSYKVLANCGFVERKRFVEEQSGDRLVEMVLLRKLNAMF